MVEPREETEAVGLDVWEGEVVAADAEPSPSPSPRPVDDEATASAAAATAASPSALVPTPPAAVLQAASCGVALEG